MKARMMAMLGLLAAASASAQSPHDPWAYCQAWDKQSKSYIFSAPTQIAGSDFLGLSEAWKAYATQKFGAKLGRADCAWAYTRDAAPKALQMAVDDRTAAGKQIEMTHWVWAR